MSDDNISELYNLSEKYFERDIVKSNKIYIKILKKINEDSDIELSNNDIKKIKKNVKKKLKFIKLYKRILTGDIEYFKNIQNINSKLYSIKNYNLAHLCIDTGDKEILRYLFIKGIPINIINNNQTLFEYALKKEDPNIINFLINVGCTLEKYIFIRKNTPDIILNYDDIDMIILEKILLFNTNKSKTINFNNIENNFDFLKKYIDLNTPLGINNFTLNNLIDGLNFMFKNKNSYYTYRKILEEELSYNLMTEYYCPKRKLDIILINLIPFINYPFKVTSNFLILNELRFIIKTLKNNKNFKNNLYNYLISNYVQKNICSLDFLGIHIFTINKNI